MCVALISVLEILLFTIMCVKQYIDPFVALGFVVIFCVATVMLTVAVQRYWGGVWVETRMSVELADTVPVAVAEQP